MQARRALQAINSTSQFVYLNRKLMNLAVAIAVNVAGTASRRRLHLRASHLNFTLDFFAPYAVLVHAPLYVLTFIPDNFG